ncbi:MAG TPA: asparagine synthase (glutamine-hydrolyzing) [Kofleriaceae bacterium]|nr:asparagine synthase (glutamine-hydrolyzing) [Kofleriaceae bacterium]
MCGIAGVFGRYDARRADQLVARMLRAVAHRGPDGEGQFSATDGEWNLGLGHRRLAIIDLSPAAVQPMIDRERELSITYNGELYNYVELRDELRGLGHEFHTSSDTEVLLNAYAEWGHDCLRRFNGMWAFALWDGKRRELFAARDRLGVKPLYYTRTVAGWIFASEIKALFATGEVTPRMRPLAVEAYLSHGLCSFDDETFFEGIRQVPPGTYVEWSSRAPMRIHRFWDLERTVTGSAPDASELRHLFEDAVRLRLRADVPVAVSLSGGIDSGAIACAMAAERARHPTAMPLSTFTISYPGMAFDESEWAKDVAAPLGGTTTMIGAFADRDADISSDIREVIEACDEPVHSPSVYNVLSLMRAVHAAGIKVILGGQGADELFWGYPWCYAYSIAHWLTHGQPLRAARELAAVLRDGNSTPLTVASYLAYQSFFTPRYWRGVRRAARFRSRQLADAADPAYARMKYGLLPVHELHRREVLSTNLQPLLRYEDRLSMRFSVEARLPFCDYRVAELAHRCRPQDLLHDGWSKFILRDAMRGMVPDEVLWRREKRGFAAPVETLLERGAGLREEAADAVQGVSELLEVDASRAAILDASKAPWQIRWRLLNVAMSQKIAHQLASS